jgi:hypothetical protein
MEKLPKPILKLATSDDPLDQSVAYKVGDLLAILFIKRAYRHIGTTQTHRQ